MTNAMDVCGKYFVSTDFMVVSPDTLRAELVSERSLLHSDTVDLIAWLMQRRGPLRDLEASVCFAPLL